MGPVVEQFYISKTEKIKKRWDRHLGPLKTLHDDVDRAINMSLSREVHAQCTGTLTYGRGGMCNIMWLLTRQVLYKTEAYTCFLVTYEKSDVP